MPEICVSIGRTRQQMMLEDSRALVAQGAKMIELRLDYLSHAPNFSEILAAREVPTILTCRRPVDGGKWRGDEETRLQLLRTAIASGADYVDLEIDVAPQVMRFGKTRRIISYHNFRETPRNIEKIYESMVAMDGDLLKVVTTANTVDDFVRMLHLQRSAPKPTVAFCMGEIGAPSRVLCGKFGAPFSFATFSTERELAPGQLPFQQMKHLYRFESINSQTRLFGVLGDPIRHSLSPLLHNTELQRLNVDAVYLPIRLPQDHFSESLDQLTELGFEGFSVTIPHKEALLRKYPKCQPEVNQIGAANTLSRNAQGEWAVENTDYQAALDAVRSGLRANESFVDKKVLVLGAGGAARAIALGLHQQKAIVTLCSRTHARSKALAESIGCRHIGWENRGAEGSEILVNCTPIGMFPNVDESPMQENWLNEGMLVFDTVYNPENTLLIKQARERECRTVSGIEMFIRQAAAQFRRFTGAECELVSLRESLRKGISPLRC